MVEMVNGYVCHNCTDVDYAKRHVDPKHPKDGPFGVNKPATEAGHGPAVLLGGALSDSKGASPPDSALGVAAVNAANPTESAAADRPAGSGPGGRLDVTA